MHAPIMTIRSADRRDRRCTQYRTCVRLRITAVGTDTRSGPRGMGDQRRMFRATLGAARRSRSVLLLRSRE